VILELHCFILNVEAILWKMSLKKFLKKNPKILILKKKKKKKKKKKSKQENKCSPIYISKKSKFSYFKQPVKKFTTNSTYFAFKKTFLIFLFIFYEILLLYLYYFSLLDLYMFMVVIFFFNILSKNLKVIILILSIKWW